MKLIECLETIEALKESLKDIEKEILWFKEKSYVDENLLCSRIGIVRIYADVLKEKLWEGMKEARKED